MKSNALVPLGMIVATPNALANISSEEIQKALQRHVTGDWGDRLRGVLNGYNKNNVRSEQFPRELVAHAIQRARNLEATPDSPGGYWPEKAGTRVYLLLESISSQTSLA